MRRLNGSVPAAIAAGPVRHWGWGWGKTGAKKSEDSQRSEKEAQPLSQDEAAAFASLRRASAARSSLTSSPLSSPSFSTADSSDATTGAEAPEAAARDVNASAESSSRLILNEIAVKNLPKAETPMKDLTRSTSDFLSKTDPNVTLGTGIVRGFSEGIKKPSSFSLRSPLFMVPKDEKSEQLIHEAIDKNQNQITRSSRLKREAEAHRMKIAQLVTGGTGYSAKEHSLFADLDYDRDWVLLGTTPEEFEKNIVRLQKLVTQYQKWERKDNRYYYGAWFLRLTVLFMVIDCTTLVLQIRELQSGYDDFQQSVEDEIVNLTARRRADIAMAVMDIQVNPPDFTPVVEAFNKEKQAMKEAAARAAASRDETLAAPQFDKHGRILNHPLDTSFAEQERLRKEDELRKRQLSLLASSVKDEKANSVASMSIISRSFSALFGQNKKSAASPSTDGSKITEEDLSAFSYAVSPTSIEAARAVRRILLPRGDDMATIVREQMVQYKAQKLASLSFPE
jgi:hypothetical protein